MTNEVGATFQSLFLDANDLAPGMTLYDRRYGAADPDDPSFAKYGGLNIGMTKWDGANESLLRLFVDIRWLFPDAPSATAYHLATLQAKSEGKRKNLTANTIGDGCCIYSYPTGQALGAARGVLAQSLDEGSHILRGVDHAIADMPDDAFIYLFTKGRVAVKYVAALAASPVACKDGPPAVHLLASRIVARIESAFPTSASRKPVPWWKKLVGYAGSAGS